jgi:hypothetical protein
MRDQNLSLQTIMTYLGKRWATVPDVRKPSNHTHYTVADGVLAAFAVFFMQSSSFLAHQRLLQSKKGRSIFVAIEGLPIEPLSRQCEVRSALLPILDELTGSISFVSKTPEEVEKGLTPLMLDMCVDGICLYGDSFFDRFRQKALTALKQAGGRRRLAGTWLWIFPRIPAKPWELSWEGYHERPE